MKIRFRKTFKWCLACAVVRSTTIPADAQPDQDGYTDRRDGKNYNIIQIADQTWLAGNIEYEHEESWCYNDSLQCNWSGRLYTYKAALQACPVGWRLPSDQDWMILEEHLGMAEEQLRTTGPRGTNEGTMLLMNGMVGFDAPICGYRRPDGSYVRANERIAYWTATEYNVEDAWHRDLRPTAGTIYRSPVTKTYALSVRCIKETD